MHMKYMFKLTSHCTITWVVTPLVKFDYSVPDTELYQLGYYY